MNKNSITSEIVKSKEIPLTQEELCELWWNAPPGVFPDPGKVSEKKQYIFFQPKVTDYGYSSKKLVRCADVWYLKEYSDPAGQALRFPYGSRKDRERSLEFEQKLKNFQMLDVWSIPDYADSEAVEISGNPEIADLETPENTQERTPFTEEEKQERRKINRAHAKEKLRQLCNLNKFHYMYTFTFAPELHENVKNLRFILPLEKQHDRHEVEKVWNKRRSAIARWCKKNQCEFRYVKVLEKHQGNRAEETDTRKHGTYHIHLATDRPIDKHVLQRLWGYGVVWVDDFNKKRKAGTRGKDDPGRNEIVIDPGVYMSKYMEKDFDDAELHGYRAYSPSQNLKQPIPERDEALIEQLLQESHAEEYTVFDATYDAEYSIHRKGKEPERVKLTIRSRIFNFRVPLGAFCKRSPMDARGSGASHAPAFSLSSLPPPGLAQAVGN